MSQPGGAAEAPAGGEEDPVEPERHQIGRYRLCFELASGGMGKVYLARVDGIGGFAKLVALKTIHPHLVDEKEFVEMFLDEARIASLITHPHVCSVIDVGRSDGTYFLAMEYLHGESLRRVLRAVYSGDKAQRHRRAYPNRIAALIAQAAAGLHAAHELTDDRGKPLGVVHRDVSPQNLFVTYDGSVKVVDFGVAKAADRLHKTSTGVVKGKAPYLAPELLRKEPVDRRADVWALGVVLWESLVGRRLFRRSAEAQTLLAILQDEVRPPSSYRPDISPELDRIVLRALERDVDRRYATAGEMARDLRRFVARAPEEDFIGPEELAAWMSEMFVDERARRLELMDQARQLPDVPGLPRISRRLSDPAPAADESSSGVIPRADQSLTFSVAEAPRGRWLAFLAIAVAVLVVGAVGLGFALGGGDGERAPDQAPVTVAGSGSRTASAPAAPTGSSAAGGAERGPDAPSADLTEGDTHGEASVEAEEREQAGEERAEVVEETVAEEETAAEQEAQATSAMRTPRGPGWVNVVSRGGWADIYRGGRRIGRSPGRVRLPAGVHRLELRPFGELPAQRIRVTVRPGRTTTKTVRLSP